MKKSYIEDAYESCLIENDINYVREFQVFTGESRNINCFGKGIKQVRNMVKYDFYLPDTHILIELDDDNHYRGGRYEQVHRVDLQKDKLASELGLVLVRIDVRNEGKYLFNLRMHVLAGYKTKTVSVESDAERLNNCHSWFIDYVNRVGLEEYLNRPVVRRKKIDL